MLNIGSTWMDLGNFERAVGARELFSRLQEKEVSLCADPRARQASSCALWKRTNTISLR